MAMRPIRGGRANTPNRPVRPQRLNIGRSYEQFKPMSEWRQEDDYDTLLVYLPGFQKEYIKVTTEDLNIVRVRGMRQIEGNRWSRFQEDYRVPENCEMRGIRARFDGGILTITMPRKIINAPPPPSTTATQAAAPKTNDEQPSSSTGTKQEKAKIPNAKEEPSKEKKPDYKQQHPQTTPLEANMTLPPQPKPAAKQEPLKEKKPDYKQQPPQTTPLEANTTWPPKPKPATKQEPLKPTPEAKDVVQSTSGSLIPKYSAPKIKDKQDDVVEKPRTTDLDKGKGKEEALHEEKTKRDLEGSSKGKAGGGYDGVISGGFRGGEGAKEENDNKKKVVGRRGMVMMNEDRKVLVNVGVGILVIVALGVQVSYTIGLIGGTKGK